MVRVWFDGFTISVAAMSDDQFQQLETEIDYSLVDYPTDYITLKSLRARFPSRPVETVSDHAQRLDTTHFMERAFVRFGFFSALDSLSANRAESLLHPEEGRASAVRDLSADYVYYGLANGLESAKQLIRRLEEAGAELARQRTGRRAP